MKFLALASLVLLPSLGVAAEPNWLQERLISAQVSETMQGRDQILPLRQYLQLPVQTQINDVIVTAATAAGQGRLEVLVDGRSTGEVRVDRQLKAITIPVNTLLRPRSTLQIRTDGNFYIAQVAVTVARNGAGPGPGPGPVPPPPPPPVDYRRVCEDFAFAEFRAEGYNNSDSLNLSAQYCSTNQDLFRDKSIYDKIYGIFRQEGYGRRDAMNLTAQYVRANLDVLYQATIFDRINTIFRDEGYGRRDSLNLTATYVRQHLNLLQQRDFSFTWVYDRLREEGYGRRDSLNMTPEILGRAPEHIMPCVRDKFDLFRRDGYGRRDSINKAIQFCSR
jgi:hypothetical protein